MGGADTSCANLQALLEDGGPFQIRGASGFRAVADLNIVYYLCGTGGLRHAGSRSFMLDDVGGSFPSHHTALHMEMETVFPNLGLGQLHSDRGIDLRIRPRHGAGCGDRSAPRRSVCRNGEHHVTERKQQKNE